MKRPISRLILARVALAAVATLFSLGLAEIGLRVFVPDAVPSAGIERDYFCEFDKTLGWAPKPNITARHERDGFSVVVHQNAWGLRAPDSLEPERQSDQKRILVLGDSYVWGYGVEQDQMMTAPEVHRSPTELINFGVSGYGTDQEYLLYRSLGTKFDVDEVDLVLTPYNDIEENMSSEEYDQYKPFFRVENGDLVLHTEHIQTSRIAPIVNEVRFRSRVINVADHALRNISNWIKLRRLNGAGQAAERSLSEADITDWDRQGVALTLRIIAALRDEVLKKGAKFSVVFVPYKPHVLLNAAQNHPLVPLIAHGLAALGITYYEPYNLFSNATRQGTPLFHIGDNHFNPQGNALFATVLTDPAKQQETMNLYDR